MLLLLPHDLLLLRLLLCMQSRALAVGAPRWGPPGRLSKVFYSLLGLGPQGLGLEGPPGGPPVLCGLYRVTCGGPQEIRVRMRGPQTLRGPHVHAFRPWGPPKPRGTKREPNACMQGPMGPHGGA